MMTFAIPARLPPIPDRYGRMSKSGGTVVRSGTVVGTLPTVPGLRQIGQHVVDDRVKTSGQQQMHVGARQRARPLPLAYGGLRQSPLCAHDLSVPVVGGVEPDDLEHPPGGEIVGRVEDGLDLGVVADPSSPR